MGTASCSFGLSFQTSIAVTRSDTDGGHCGGGGNPTTGNPHPAAGPGDASNPQGNEVGNPHNSAGCTADPHGRVGTDGSQ